MKNGHVARVRSNALFGSALPFPCRPAAYSLNSWKPVRTCSTARRGVARLVVITPIMGKAMRTSIHLYVTSIPRSNDRRMKLFDLIQNRDIAPQNT